MNFKARAGPPFAFQGVRQMAVQAQGGFVLGLGPLPIFLGLGGFSLLEQGLDLAGHNALPRLLQAVAGLPRLGLQFQRLGESGLRPLGPPLFEEAKP